VRRRISRSVIRTNLLLGGILPFVSCGHIGVDRVLDDSHAGGGVESLGDGGSTDGDETGGAGGEVFVGIGGQPGGTGGAADSGGSESVGGALSSGGVADVGGSMGAGGEEGGGGSENSGGMTGDGGQAGVGGSEGELEPCSTGEFSTPVKIANLAVEGELWGPSLTGDGLTLFFAASDPVGENIYRAERPDRASAFGAASEVSELNVRQRQGTPFINFEGTRIYFMVQEGADQTVRDLFYAERETKAGTFGSAQPLLGINTKYREHLPWVSKDELTIYYTGYREPDLWKSDIWKATRMDASLPFSNAKSVTSFGGVEDGSPSLAPDGLTLFFTSDRMESFDVWTASRNTQDELFSRPVRNAQLSGAADEVNLNLSWDGREIVFSSSRDGTQSLWIASRDCD
jgi:hypothetical protein